MHFLAHGDQLGVAVAVLPPDHGRKVVGLNEALGGGEITVREPVTN